MTGDPVASRRRIVSRTTESYSAVNSPCEMRPARRSWTPSINAAGLGMLPMGSVGSITIVSVEEALRRQPERSRPTSIGRLPATVHGAAHASSQTSRAQGRPDGVEQGVAAERLSEERNRAGLEGSPARLFVVVRGQNDNRDPGARSGQMPQEVEAIHPGHPQIEHKASGVRSMSGLHLVSEGSGSPSGSLV